MKEPDPYTPTSPYSYFRDLATVAKASEATTRAIDAGMPRVEHLSLGQAEFPHPIHGGLQEARNRLARLESRDVTVAGGAAGFLPASGTLPTCLGELFAEAARAEAVISRELPKEPLPETGMFVYSPRLSTGAAVAVQAAEADPPTEANVDDTVQASAVAYVTGMVDVS